MLLQIPIFIGLYSSISRIIHDPTTLTTFSYPFIQNLSWIQTISADISKFDASLFGIVDLAKPALKNGVVYWPAMLIVAASAVAQFFQSKQLLPDSKDSRGLRRILKDASSGKQADQGEVNAAVGRSTRYFLPLMIFVITVNIASALSLYWLTSGIVAYIQQAKVLGQDETEMEAVASNGSKKIIEGEVIPPKTQNTKKKKSSKKNKRRKR